jgi:hypothetical protein
VLELISLKIVIYAFAVDFGRKGQLARSGDVN